ncbi:MAG: hypothetical protein WAU70_06350 [Flavobacteriales bacterium]
MTIARVIEQLLQLDFVRADFSSAEELLNELSLVIGRDFPGEAIPGHVSQNNMPPAALNMMTEVDSPIILVDSIPHIPQWFIYPMDNLSQVEGRILGISGMLNAYSRESIVLVDGEIQSFEIRYEGPNGVELVFSKEDQHGFGNTYLNAGIVWQ